MNSREMDEYIEKRINKASVLGIENYDLSQSGNGSVYLIVNRCNNDINCDVLIKSNRRTSINIAYTISDVTDGEITTQHVNNINIYGGSGMISTEELLISCGANTVDISNLDASNVYNMAFMFANCSSKILGINKLNTSNVENMYRVFDSYICKGNLDINGFDTRKVNTMMQMFNNASIEGDLNISNIDMSNIISTNGMFYMTKVNGSVNIKNIIGADKAMLTGMFGIYTTVNTSDILKLYRKTVKAIPSKVSIEDKYIQAEYNEALERATQVLKDSKRKLLWLKAQR